MTDCDGALHPSARQGILLFNQGKYFEAHEELEIAWKEERGKVRQLYQGVLQAAVTYLHITRGNYPGALKVYTRSMRRLRQWPEVCRGVDVKRLRQDLTAAIERLSQLGESRIAEFDLGSLQPVVWKEVLDE